MSKLTALRPFRRRTDVGTAEAGVSSEAADEDATRSEQANDPGRTPARPGDSGGKDATAETADTPAPPRSDRSALVGRVAVILLPAIALVLACGAGYLKWYQASAAADSGAAAESVRAASENTIAILSYRADSVAQDLQAASHRLTGDFKESYSSLTSDVVIPGAQQQQITSVATVPAAASMSADKDHAVVLLFVNQTITQGDTAPSDTASSVKVTLDRVDNRWLISGFEPV